MKTFQHPGMGLACGLAVALATMPLTHAWQPGTGSPSAVDGFVVDTTNRRDVIAFYHCVYQASEGYAARMGWTVRPYPEANHAPKVVVNGLAGTSPLQVDVEVGQPLTLDAAGTTDPDGHELRYRWFHYPEAGFVPGARLAGLSISDANTSRATITATTACRPAWMPIKAPCPAGVAHVILAVTDAGTPSLTSYRRVIVNVRARAVSRPAP